MCRKGILSWRSPLTQPSQMRSSQGVLKQRAVSSLLKRDHLTWLRVFSVYKKKSNPRPFLSTHHVRRQGPACRDHRSSTAPPRRWQLLQPRLRIPAWILRESKATSRLNFSPHADLRCARMDGVTHPPNLG
ncbi:uncharacterized protein ACIB01_015411 [Guaruba guarouba]